ncbi:MAG TPA: autotransporter outer membrane beta-barrel domain-containing protein, partial [Methylovirgula sp.]|nr:autotransporter outer membrane beta-barrel domain-containing protein [Methylovirgula sp.]
GASSNAIQPLGYSSEQSIFSASVAQAYGRVLKGPPPVVYVPHWNAWGTAFGGVSFSDGNAATGTNQLQASTYGFAAGIDYHLSADTIFGFALGGGGTNWQLASIGGTGRSAALQTGVYAITRNGPLYGAAAFGFGNNWFTTNRAALGDQLQANFGGQSYGGRVEGGYHIAALPFGFTPYGALQAQDFETPNYNETDLTGGGFGLSYASMSATDVRTELGARFEEITALGGMPLVLHGRLAWAHDFVSNPSLNAAFQALPGTNFTVYGAPIPHDSALTSVGAEMRLAPNWSVLAKFDGEFAGTAQTYAGTGTLKYTW